MPSQIFGDIYDITVARVQTEFGERRFRTFLINTDPVTLVDAGLPNTAEAIFEAIDELGAWPERLIITHGDPDHIGGFDAVVDRYAPESWVPHETEVPGETTPDHRYHDGDTIGSITAVRVAGHEPDNYVLIDEAAGFAIMGDALSGADQRGLPEGYLILPPGDKSKDLNEAEANLEKLLEYQFEAALVFHGSSVLQNGSEIITRFVNYPGKR